MKNNLFIEKEDKIIKSSDYCKSNGDKRGENCKGDEIYLNTSFPKGDKSRGKAMVLLALGKQQTIAHLKEEIRKLSINDLSKNKTQLESLSEFKEKVLALLSEVEGKWRM